MVPVSHKIDKHKQVKVKGVSAVTNQHICQKIEYLKKDNDLD